MDNILEIKNLTKKYKDFTLDDISFDLKKGYIMGFVGPNGVGKSTTIKLIMNLIKKNAGEIKIFGLDNIKNEEDIKQRIGFVYDEFYFYEMLNAKESGKIIGRFYKEWNEKMFNKYLKEFDLDEKKKIKDMSKGMKMKLQIAIALSHNAELIVMDEPTSGLDPIFRTEILDILQDIIQDEKRSILFSTHIISDLEKIADYITFINDGKIVFSEEIENVYENYSLIKGNKEEFTEEMKHKCIGFKENKFGLEGLVKKKVEINSEKITKGKASLEEIMYYIVRGNKNAKSII